MTEKEKFRVRGYMDRALLALSKAELELYYAWVIEHPRPPHFDSAITPLLQAVTDLQEAIKSNRRGEEAAGGRSR